MSAINTRPEKPEPVTVWWIVVSEYKDISVSGGSSIYSSVHTVQSVHASEVVERGGTVTTKKGTPCYREEAFALMAAAHMQTERVRTTTRELHTATHTHDHASRTLAGLRTRLKELGVEL